MTSSVAPRAWADPPLAIVVGDSVARDYPPDDYGANIQGWGYYLGVHLSNGMTWRNDAVGAQSSRSFIVQGRWATTIAAHPQYIFIQFGLGDVYGIDAPPTDPETEYRANLHQMITDARSIGAIPILVTPAIQRWSNPGSDLLGRPNGLEQYATATIEQATADNVRMVDMQAWSGQICDSMGVTKCQELYGFVYPGPPWPLPAGTKDQLHFSHYGADQAAQMIIDRLRTLQPEVPTHLAAPAVPALPGFAWKLFTCSALLATLGTASRRSGR